MSDGAPGAVTGPRRGRVSLVLDGELVDAHEGAVLELEVLLERQKGDEMPSDVVAAAEHVADLEDRLRKAAVEYVFVGMGRGRWRKLKADHPPSDAQRAEGAEYDVEVFPFEAMAACIESPKLTIVDLYKLNDEILDESQFLQLWGACLRANKGVAGGDGLGGSEAARNAVASVRRRFEQPSDSESAAAS